MRRPVKPFVTEYKASSRRNPAASGEQGVFESERPAPKSFDFMQRPDSDDYYDAAMRAADALFSIPSSAGPAGSNPDGATRDDMSPPPRHFDDEGQPDISFSEKGGGRILRVLDEAPPPEYAALEAELTPKRRGRKPGSKNKPKTAMPAQAALMRDLTPPAPVQPAPVVTVPAMPAARKIPALTVQAATKPASAVELAPLDGDAPTRSGKRFSWVRDNLKPGEEWKRRRLPRVCW